MKRRSPAPASRPVSPTPFRKAASSTPFCLAPCSISELVQSTQSSPLPRPQETVPSSTWYPSTLAGSDSCSTLPTHDCCLPYWEQESCSCCVHTQPPHACKTRTDELLESPSSDDTPPRQDEDDVTDAGAARFNFPLLRDIKWRTPSVSVSLAVLGLFVLALVAITAVSRTVNASKMEKLEVLPDLVEKEEAEAAVPKHATLASVEIQGAKTTPTRGLRKSKAKTKKAAARRQAATAPKPRAVAHRRTKPSTSRRRLTKAVRRTTKRNRVPPISSRRSRKPQRTRSAATTKRKAASTTLHGLRKLKANTHKAAKKKQATTAAKPRTRAKARTVAITSRRRLTNGNGVVRSTKRTKAPPNSSRRRGKLRSTRAAAPTKRTGRAKRREAAHPRPRSTTAWNAPAVWTTGAPLGAPVGGEMPQVATMSLQRPMTTTAKDVDSGRVFGDWKENTSSGFGREGRSSGTKHSHPPPSSSQILGSRFVGTARNYLEAVTISLAVGSSTDSDDEGVAEAMTEDYELPPRRKEKETSATATADESEEEVWSGEPGEAER